MSRLGRTASISGALAMTLGLLTDETSDSFEWPVGIDDPSAMVERIEVALTEIQLEINIPAEVIVAFLAYNGGSVRHTVDAIKTTVAWREGRQMFLNEMRIAYPRYEFLANCRRSGSGSSSIFGQSLDKRLVFYESFGRNFSRELHQEFSTSEFGELTIVWCEQMMNAAVMNVDSGLRADYALYTPLLTHMLSKEEVSDVATITSIEESFCKPLRFASDEMKEKLELGHCKSAGLIGVVDWSEVDCDKLLQNTELMRTAAATINTHYPFLFYKLYHVNLPSDMLQMAKIMRTMRSVLGVELLRKSIFVGLDNEKLRKATEMLDSTGGSALAEASATKLSPEEIRRRSRMAPRKRKELERKEEEERKEKEMEEQRRAEAAQKAEATEEVESLEMLQKRLKCLQSDISREWLPAAYGGLCQTALCEAQEMFTKLIGLSSKATPKKYLPFQKEPAVYKKAEEETEEGKDEKTEDSLTEATSAETPKSKESIRERLMRGRRRSREDDDEAAKFASAPSGRSARKSQKSAMPSVLASMVLSPLNPEGIVKELTKKKPLRPNERETVRFPASRGDHFTWQFTLDQPTFEVQFEVVFQAEGYRGKTVKQVCRAAAPVRVGHYPMYGDFVAVAKGKLEVSFLNQKREGQRRIVLNYTIVQEHWHPDYIAKYLPPVVEESAAQHSRDRRHRRQASMGRSSSKTRAKLMERTAGGKASTAPAGSSSQRKGTVESEDVVDDTPGPPGLDRAKSHEQDEARGRLAKTALQAPADMARSRSTGPPKKDVSRRGSKKRSRKKT